MTKLSLGYCRESVSFLDVLVANIASDHLCPEKGHIKYTFTFYQLSPFRFEEESPLKLPRWVGICRENQIGGENKDLST